MAPLLASFSPETQGDLASTRLLPPLSRVWIQTAESDADSSTGAANATGISATAAKYNDILLSSTATFTADTASAESRGQVVVLPLGTDDLGRDVFGRMMYGMRMSLVIAFGGVLLTVLIGFSLGCAAGYRGGLIDAILMRVTDLFLALPSFFVVLACIAFLGSSVTVLIVVLAATGWMSIARMVRNEIASLAGKEFVLAARMFGRTSLEILRDHLLPNVLPTLMAASVLQLANIVLAEAALSFLGLGIQPPTASLGNMIGESMAYIQDAWWVGAFPGIVLTAFVVSANLATQRIERTSLSIE
jgi:peptide/nickel transport system permease protein